MAGSVTEAVGVEAAVERVLAALPPDAASRGRRFLLGIAGPPAAGKSTLAAALRDALNRGRGPGGNSESGDGGEGRSEVAAIAGLDGFHYDDQVLLARGHLPPQGRAVHLRRGGLRGDARTSRGAFP